MAISGYSVGLLVTLLLGLLMAINGYFIGGY
jgi:hypothetical protein